MNIVELNGRPLKILIGGFPCTKFSIAQKKDRETLPYSGEAIVLGKKDQGYA